LPHILLPFRLHGAKSSSTNLQGGICFPCAGDFSQVLNRIALQGIHTKEVAGASLAGWWCRWSQVFGPDPLSRSPSAEARATFRLRSACQIAFPLEPERLFGPTWPRTTNIYPKSSPRPPTWAPRAAQVRPQTLQERPGIVHRGPMSGPRPPRETQERPTTAHRGSESDPGPPTFDNQSTS